VGKHDSAPTHGWVTASRFAKRIIIVFLISAALLAIEIAWIVSAVNKDCREPYKIRAGIGSHWIVLFTGSSHSGCADPY